MVNANEENLKTKLGRGIYNGTLVMYFNKGIVRDWLFSSSMKKGLWLVIDTEGNTCDLQDIGNSSNTFKTDVRNLVRASHLEQYGLLKRNKVTTRSLENYTHYKHVDKVDAMTDWSKKEYDSFFEPVERTNTTNTTMENNTMKSKVIHSNVDAAKVAAKLTAGNSLNKVVLAKVKPHLPFGTKGYADTALGAVVVANLAVLAVQNFAAGNEKAKYAADAMLQASMLDFMGQFKFEEMLADVLTAVELPEIEVNEQA